MAFTSALSGRLDAVRTLGIPMPEEDGTPPDLVVPDQGAVVRGLRALFGLRGPIPQ
ncbi:hypothetical protein [Streptomyces sp. XY332]|uniref:hypothetical protein n=1 Tax=Streptomyces sp. XY332 TaxID=1415561 RepID=UPI003B63A66E